MGERLPSTSRATLNATAIFLEAAELSLTERAGLSHLMRHKLTRHFWYYNDALQPRESLRGPEEFCMALCMLAAMGEEGLRPE